MAAHPSEAQLEEVRDEIVEVGVQLRAQPRGKLNAAEAQLEEVRDEIVEVLQSWLDREVKDRYQQIDQKLDLLVATVVGPKRRKLLSMNSASPKGRPTLFRSDTQLSSQRQHSFLPSLRANIDDLTTVDDSPPKNPSKMFTRVGTNVSSVAGFELKSKSVFGFFSRATNFGSSRMSPEPRRRLSSHRYIAEVQAFIAQHKGRGPFAVKLWRFLENPYSSVWAWLYSIFIPILVLTSVAISFFQTVQDSSLRGGAGMWMQTIFESLYAAELIVRFFVCPDRCLFFTNGYNWIDVASALPLVLRIFGDRDELESNEHVSENWAKSIVVTLPLVRLLKIVRRFEKFRLLTNAFSMAGEALPVLLYTLMLIALFFSVLIYFIEPLENFASLPESLWFTFVTMTTVGYGDKTPTSVGGHFATICLMICSFLYMAMPIGIVGSAFSEVWGNRDRLLLMHRIREAFLQEGFTGDSIQKIVAFFDDDGDGELDLHEFKMMLQTMHVDISEERVMQLHEEIDKDGDGAVNVAELMNALFPKGYFDAWRHAHEAFKSSPAQTVDNDIIGPSPQPPTVVEEVESPPGAPPKTSALVSDDIAREAKSSNHAAGVRFGNHLDVVDAFERPPELPPTTVCWNF